MPPLKLKLSVKPGNDEISVSANIPEPKPTIGSTSIYSTVWMMILLIYGIFFIFGVMNLLGELQNKLYPKMSEDVEVDYGNTIPCSLVAVHNDNKTILAFRDFTNGRCYINVWDETFEKEMGFWSAQESLVTGYFHYIRDLINPRILIDLVGQHIANYCDGLQSHWIVIICKEEAERRKTAYGDSVTRIQYFCKPHMFCPKCP